jgi:hypothetical protein
MPSSSNFNPVQSLSRVFTATSRSAIALVRVACSSLRNANDSSALERFVRITHPFHPLRGQQFACVGERYNRYGKRLLLQVDDQTLCSVPPQWTDLVAAELTTAIDEYIAHHNANPTPFIWTASARDILQKVIRANSRLSSKQNATLH